MFENSYVSPYAKVKCEPKGEHCCLPCTQNAPITQKPTIVAAPTVTSAPGKYDYSDKHFSSSSSYQGTPSPSDSVCSSVSGKESLSSGSPRDFMANSRLSQPPIPPYSAPDVRYVKE
ncbi:hypothetical protein CHS0354_017888 [Potamilus streckersoni]|uniref:Uncharacterized protein n=1 Tax=Potamilus streckersoni TaxID=2493646 RepID=A0AAE0W5W6_9BIVA|nr:hypothetical protein CHS0354_017888 [Potamilus streckersoni]